MEIKYWICLVTETGRRFHLEPCETEEEAEARMKLCHGVLIDPVTDEAWPLVVEREM